ncbi:MAG: Hsp20/alpha crystallin family protein [Planctomycetaceae bacterium]
MTGMTLFDRRGSGLVDDFRREFDALFHQFFEGGNGSSWAATMFHPQANVAESENDYEITLDLPGMKPEDVTIELQQGHLVVTGERKQEHEDEGKTWHRVERSCGTFRRVIPLEAAADADKIDAAFRDGVLTITVPKAEEAKPKRINVHT